SLFTFNVPASPLTALSGISVECAKATLPEFKREFLGPLLITHFGFSGPAILKLSAFAARELNACGYNTPLLIDWIPETTDEVVKLAILGKKEGQPAKSVSQDPLFSLPKNLWKTLIELAGVDKNFPWGRLTKAQVSEVIVRLKRD